MAKLLKLVEAVVTDEVCVELEDLEPATPVKTVGSEKEGYERPPSVYPGILTLPPPPPGSFPESLLSTPPPAPPRSDRESRWSRLGWERNPGCWLVWSREEVEESLALPTLSPRLSCRMERSGRKEVKERRGLKKRQEIRRQRKECL